VIETISPWRSVRLRHEAAPLLKEREQYLTHLLQRGFGRAVVRCTAAYLVHIVRVMNMTSLRSVGQEEIETLGLRFVFSCPRFVPLRRRMPAKLTHAPFAHSCCFSTGRAPWSVKLADCYVKTWISNGEQLSSTAIGSIVRE